MAYIQVFKEAFNLLRRTKLVWVFSTLSLFANFIPPDRRVRGDLGLICGYFLLSFIFIFISFRAQPGLIYVINQTLNNEKVSFSDGWFQGIKYLFRIIGVTLIVSPVFFILLTLSFATKHQLEVVSFSFVMTTFVSGLLFFAYCGVVINGIKPFRAAWKALLITTNNIIKIFILSIKFEIIRVIPLCMFIIALSYSTLKMHIPSPLSLDYMTYLKLITDPIVSVAIQISYILIFPLESIVWIIAYNQFTREISYPGIASRHEEAQPEIQNSTP